MLSGTTPLLVSPPDINVQEGQTAAYVATLDPTGGQSAIFSLVHAPVGASINPITGLFIWTPPEMQQISKVNIKAGEPGNPDNYSIATLTVNVWDVPPTVQIPGAQTTIVGVAYAETIPFFDPNHDTWTASVDYGDGTVTVYASIGQEKVFPIAHTYTTPGTYVIGVTIRDSQNGVGHGYFAVNVQASAPATQGEGGGSIEPAPAPVSVTVALPEPKMVNRNLHAGGLNEHRPQYHKPNHRKSAIVHHNPLELTHH